MKAIFDTKAASGYDDDIVRRYHFPNRYLPVARQAVGDWIVYREPKRNAGREGYVAVARLVAIKADPTRPGHSYGLVDSFLPLDAVVPLRRASGFYELRLQQVAAPRRLSRRHRRTTHSFPLAQADRSLFGLDLARRGRPIATCSSSSTLS